MNKIILYVKDAQHVTVAMFTKEIEEVPPKADSYKSSFDKLVGTLEYDIYTEKYTLRLVTESIKPNPLLYGQMRDKLLANNWKCDYDNIGN